MINMFLKSHAAAKKQAEDLTTEWEKLSQKLEELDKKREVQEEA